MQGLPFDQPGRFYRGNLHTHSTRSDGRQAPEAVIAAYREQGYDFLALTDHFLERYDFPITDTRAWRTPGFTTLLGAELHAPAIEVGDPWHIVAVGLPLDFAPTMPGETGPQLAARARAAGAFVGMAHPAWYCLTLDDALSLDAAHAVEIYNTICALENDRGHAWHIADMLLARGRRLLAYAADDAHFDPVRPPDHGQAWVQVRATALDPDALLAALKAGHYYASQGPEIEDIRLDGDTIHIACSPASAIFLSGRGSKRGAAYGARLTEATFSLAPVQGGYGRVTIVDAAGKRAWSNPFWLD
ncbi:MAG TPA: CehA/McbA family metallohydrolase [Thermomicrobiales bacterium]|nr:CehA/McbA family metallohydrolase [Thermomicrobiales bacterium]